MDAVEALERAYAACRAQLLTLEGISGETARPVFGEGPLHPAAMLIGEAPGAEETEAGRPFVGRAGKNLERFLESVSLSRKALFVTNAVKYRPFRVGKSGRKANRSPLRSELEQGRALLLREIALVEPELIVTLGNSPLWALTGKSAIGTLHGRLIDCPMESGARELFPLYHPASLMYNPSLEEAYQRDMETLAALLAQRFSGANPLF